MPFTDPRYGVAHLDAWGIVLGLAALVGGGVALTWSWQLRRWWHHHPFRQVIHRHLAGALTATTLLLAIATLSHLLGWTIYSLPILGIVGLALLVAVAVCWRWLFVPDLQRYEKGHPEVVPKGAHLKLSERNGTDIPLFATVGGAFLAYFGFEWHPWNHSFHMGMWILGGLTGYAIGSLVATKTALLPRIEPEPTSRGARGRQTRT